MRAVRGEPRAAASSSVRNSTGIDRKVGSPGRRSQLPVAVEALFDSDGWGWPGRGAEGVAGVGGDRGGRGAALDERSVYFLARLSPRYPTIEVRVADVCLDAGSAVLLAGLTRALVATALAEARRGTPAAAAPARQVAAALAAAARHGLAGAGTDPVTGQAVDAPALRARLLDHVHSALRDHGDRQIITKLLRLLDDRGTGADRQRALFTSAASTLAFIKALARETRPATGRA